MNGTGGASVTVSTVFQALWTVFFMVVQAYVIMLRGRTIITNSMKQHLLSAAVAAVLSFGASAQVFEEGAKFLHAGLGVGSPYAYSGSKMGVPPLHASFEMGVTDKIGVGGLIGYTSSTWDQAFFTTNYSWKFSYLIIGARGAYHFLDHEKIDAYGGAMLGYNIASAKFESNDADLERLVTEPSVGGLAFGAFVGGRYMFSDNSGVFAELGYNIAWLSVGYTAKF